VSGPDRREAIISAARQLFAQRGYHATTTKDIARAAGVAEGTIFRYFPTKAELLVELAGPPVLAVLTHTAEAVQAADLADPQAVWRILRQYLGERWQLMFDNQDVIQIVFAEVATFPQLFGEFVRRALIDPAGPGARILQVLQGTGTFRPLPLETMVALLGGPLLALFQIRRAGLTAPPATGDSAILDQMTDVLLFGLTGRRMGV